MKNENLDSKKMLLGVLIGGVIGAGICCSIHAARNHKVPVMKKIGRTIAEVGEMLENCNLNDPVEVIGSLEQTIPKGVDVFNNLTDWLSTGLTLWKKLKKG